MVESAAVQRTIEAVWRIESAKLIARLARVVATWASLRISHRTAHDADGDIHEAIDDDVGDDLLRVIPDRVPRTHVGPRY